MRYAFLFVLVLLGLSTPILAAEPTADDAKPALGMSILGNSDAPKSLYIVPWKASEMGLETKFSSSLLNEDMVPVDKPVFKRELDFYKISHP